METQQASDSTFEFIPSKKIESFGATVWHEFSPLALKYDAVNLGQGFPNFSPDPELAEAAGEAVTRGLKEGVTVEHVSKETGRGDLLNHYARPGGHMRLVNALSETYSPLFGRRIDPLTEIQVTVGASEALFTAIQAFMGPGDEAVLIEPFFDIYIGSIHLAGGTPRYVSLKLARGKEHEPFTSSSQWVIHTDELEAVMNEKTRVVVINSPHNPSGKVFTEQELQGIANVISKYKNCIVISDEVYEWMTYDDVKFTRFATLPGMWQRTITIGSAAKTFSITGWKIGWIMGPSDLVQACARAHQYISFAVATPFQEAVAVGFETAAKKNYFEWLAKTYQKKRDFLVSVLREVGLTPVVPQGAFFVLADISKIKLKGDEGKDKSITKMNMHLKDWNVCRWLTTEIGVAAIPCSAFYCDEHSEGASNLIRFCFCKTDDVLEQAAQHFRKLNTIFSSYEEEQQQQ
ncbi:Kynurenine--oxoglutarate transaminase 3 [Balamuthia mandrillaris]